MGEVCSHQDEDSYDKDDMIATLTILKTIGKTFGAFSTYAAFNVSG